MITANNTSKWSDKKTYNEAIISRYLHPLEEAARLEGSAPFELQRAVLRDLQEYFANDMSIRSPTTVVTALMAEEFHALIKRVMSHISAENIESLDLRESRAEVKHALLSYKDIPCRSPVLIDAYDHDQGLVRLRYYTSTKSPAEIFYVDGKQTAPAYAKYRACRFFRRTLLSERIVWLPVAGASLLEVFFGDEPVSVTVGDKLFAPGAASSAGLLEEARMAYPTSRGGRPQLPQGLRGLKIRILRLLAGSALVRRVFGGAWVFIDSDIEADDNAEHLYRWVRLHHPEISCWFLLARSSPDWERLKKDGFRLMPIGFLHKLLLLNSEHIVSSHDDYESAELDRRFYGDIMKWRFSFVPHGITKDDASHWLSNRTFDLFVTMSPDEYSSIVGDDTPYIYTARETRLTGFPRDDKLLELSKHMPPSEIDAILLMPTWRHSMTAALVSGMTNKEKAEFFANSEYVQRWRTLLRNSELKELVSEYGVKLIFMPHPNSVPYLEAFDVPAHVKVVTKADTRVLPLLCRGKAMITDYSSVAFEMANLRRPVFYYQFDRENFYGGGHYLREGYFNYERDGFGPVAEREDELIRNIREFLTNGLKIMPEYFTRMERALPKLDGQACRRVFDSILSIKQPFRRDAKR